MAAAAQRRRPLRQRSMQYPRSAYPGSCPRRQPTTLRRIGDHRPPGLLLCARHPRSWCPSSKRCLTKPLFPPKPRRGRSGLCPLCTADPTLSAKTTNLPKGDPKVGGPLGCEPCSGLTLPTPQAWVGSVAGDAGHGAHPQLGGPRPPSSGFCARPSEPMLAVLGAPKPRRSARRFWAQVQRSRDSSTTPYRGSSLRMQAK